VSDEIEMAEAIGRTGEIDRDLCRRTARVRFSAQAMIEPYFALYEAISERRRLRAASMPAYAGTAPMMMG